MVAAIGDDIDFEIVMAVHDSWSTIRKIPNYAQVAGEILFRKIFEIAPAALNMYSFGPEFVGNEESLYQSEIFQTHAQGVVSMLDIAVNMLGPDLEPALIALGQLGARHVEYGVLPAHYGIVGEALFYTLEVALGDKEWTPRVKYGWTMIYGLVSTAMMTGAERRMAQKERQLQRRRQVVAEASQKPAVKAESSSLSGGRRRGTGKKKGVASSLAEITGIRSLSKTSPDVSRQEQVSRLLQDALSVASSSGSSTTTGIGSTTCDESDSTLDLNESSSYVETMDNVYRSWDKVKAIPNYQEVAGVLLFQKIFEIAPAAKALFGFTEQYTEDDDKLYKDPNFLTHAVRVVNMLDAAVNMLGPDLEPVTHALKLLGARHVAYGVIPDHYPIVGQALLSTLEAALGDSWTPKVKEGWTAIYGFVSTTMIAGAKDEKARSMRGPGLVTPAIIPAPNTRQC